MTRRTRGEGTIYWKASRDAFIVKLRDPVTGKRVERSVKTKKEADRALREMKNAAESHSALVASNVTFGKWVEIWCEQHLPSPRRKKSTQDEYESRLRLHMVPAFGRSTLASITSADLERFFDSKAAQLSESSCRSLVKTTSAVFETARKKRLIRENPCKDVERKTGAEAAKTPCPSPESVRDLLAAAKGSTLENLLPVAAFTGARVGELLAMKWSDLQLDQDVPTWTVARTVTRDSGREVFGEDTKTRRVRTLALSGEVAKALRRQRARVAGLRLRAGDIWHELDLVFPSEVGTLWNSSNARKILRPIAKSVGFEGLFHSLRVAAATYGLELNPDHLVSKMLGHSSTVITKTIYARPNSVAYLPVAQSLESTYAFTSEEPSTKVS